MRIAIVAVWLVATASAAFAQTSTDNKPGDSPHSTGRTVVPADPGVNQPQGPTGPINTGTTGGAPAESPQGQTPPNMQSAPEGSSKTNVEPSK